MTRPPRQRQEDGSGPVQDKAFEILVRQHHRRLLGYALSIVRREDVAEELVQDAFVESYRCLDRFDPSRDFGAWVRGILRMKYYEWARRRRVVSMDDALLEALEGQHRTWDRAWEEDSSEAILALRQCIDRLQVTARRIVDLFYFKKRSCAEVAGRVKASEDAVKKRLERIRGHLGDCIQERMKANPPGREF